MGFASECLAAVGLTVVCQFLCSLFSPSPVQLWQEEIRDVVGYFELSVQSPTVVFSFLLLLQNSIENIFIIGILDCCYNGFIKQFCWIFKLPNPGTSR